MKKWKCTVCGYIHTGDEPPDECPICAADKSEFIEIAGVVDPSETTKAEMPEEETEDAESAGNELEETEPVTWFARIANLMLQNHLHPIAVHAPNGIVPAAVVFLLLALLFNISSFELASYYNLVFVLVAMPMVLFSGFIEWQKHYKGVRTITFMVKIGSGIIVLISLIVLVVWRYTTPEVASPTSPFRLIYFLVHIIALCATGLAGHLGGKLVFGNKKG